MSWLFSQALAVEFSADICSDGVPSAPSSGNPIQQAYCAPDKMTAFSRLSRFGMTFKPLTEDRGAALLTSYRAAFPARTSALPEKAPESTASAPACGATWPELSVRYCLASSSWKTHRSLWEEALPWSSVTLPRWGMTRTGHVLAHPTSERPISATGSGLWATPTASQARSEGLIMKMRENVDAGILSEAEAEAMISGSLRPARMKAWPTPKANDAEKRWTTPTKSDHKGSGPQMLRSDGKLRGDRLDYATERTPEGLPTGGQLNPTWVEWLMGWPLGWTDLKPLATDRFREWQQQHSAFCARQNKS